MTTYVNRRSLLRGGLGLAATTTALAGLPGGPALATGRSGAIIPTDSDIYGVPTMNPLIEQRADPFITRPVGGMYYMTGSVPEYDRIVVRGASSIVGLATAGEATVWRRPSSGKMGGHIWAPELHRIDGRWYIYFAAGDSDNVFRIRMYVLESAADDPRDQSAWVLRGQMRTPWESFSLDATTFEHDGHRYYVWAQSEPELDVNTSLYIAEMSSPLAIVGDPVRIATPTRSWETQGFAVNEGAAVIKRNGRIFMTFSASATDSRYCMGLLTADARANLLDAAAWTKNPDPVFVTNEQTQQYGPGHNSFTVAEDGETDVLVYHARDYRDIVGDPLYDPNRHTRVQKLYWHEDGTPLFGVPVGKGGPIVRLSPANARSTFVRHHEFEMRVDGDVRELADSQFRFVPGFLGEPSEAIQSVNSPDRYVQVIGKALHLTAYEDTAPYAASTSFIREPAQTNKSAVSLRLADRPTTYLRHDKGRLTVGPGDDGAHSKFWLS